MGVGFLSDSQEELVHNMPGHIKLVKGAVDPDPTDFLWPTMDMKKEDQAKPYDPKASVWIQDPKTHGYKEGLLESGDITQLGMEGADLNALKGGRKAMIKMETRIRELESELDAENRRHADVTKNLRKSERSIKELTFAADEDRKNHERMQALIDQLQGKVKSYKKQIEEAEEIAALNLAKYRKVAGALGDAEASADANEQAMAMRKARAKSASLGL